MLTIYPYSMPPASTPIVDPGNGTLTTKDGRYLLLSLLNRTGGSSGAPDVGSGLVIGDTPFGIINDWSEFVIVPFGGTAVIPPLSVGASIVIYNGDIHSLNVQAQNNVQIDSLALGTPYSLASNKMQIFSCFSPTQIRSMQLG